MGLGLLSQEEGQGDEGCCDSCGEYAKNGNSVPIFLKGEACIEESEKRTPLICFLTGLLGAMWNKIHRFISLL
jgi:hypothetical protein